MSEDKTTTNGTNSEKNERSHAQLLSQYAILMNVYGRDSTEAKKFREDHADDEQFVRLIEKLHDLDDRLNAGDLLDADDHLPDSQPKN